jgi:lipoate-protein ligase A
VAPQSIEQRVHSVEERVTALEELPGRLDRLGTQILDMRTEMREEFSAIRGEPRGPDTPSLVSLRDAIQENGERIMTQVRVLHEDLVVRIAEPSKRKRRR